MAIKDKPTGYTISSLSHSTSKTISAKFNFFADCLNIINLKAGEYCHFEVETHISLLNSIKHSVNFRILDFRPKESNELILQIKYIFETHPLFNDQDILYIKHYQNAKQSIDTIANYPPVKIKSDLTPLKNEIEKTFQIFSSNYIENLVGEISKCIECKRTLKYHMEDLDYLARMIFSYFYLNDYRRVDIGGFISKILDTSVKKYGRKIYTDAIIPKDLVERIKIHNKSERKFDQELFNEVDSLLKNRTLKNKIEGFINLAYSQKHRYSFIFKIDNCYIDGNETLISGLRLFDTGEFKKSNAANLTHSSANEFLHVPSVLFEYQVSAYSQDGAINQSLIELKGKIDRVGFILNKRINLNTYGYLIKSMDGHYFVNEIYRRTSIHKGDVEDVNKRNTKINKQEFKQFFAEREMILAEAYGEDNISKSLHGYVKFMEQITKKSIGSIDMKNTGIHKRIWAMAYLFLLMEEEDIKFQTRAWAYTVIINSIPIPIIGKEKPALHDFYDREYLPSISEMKKRFKHTHTNYRINIATNSKKVESQEVVFNYYMRYLLLLTNYRNIKEHIDLDEVRVASKLKVPINILFNRVLNFLLREMNKSDNANSTPEKIIEGLFISGKKKVDLFMNN